ncbi:MAG: hypothetical protein ACO3DQ_01575 [Cephaloticoccus sp.]
MENPTTTASAREIRLQHLTHEVSIQSIGILYLLGAVISVVSAVMALVQGEAESSRVAVSLLLLGFGAAQLWIGLKLRRLDASANVPATVLACVGLLAFPLGTLINAYVLYLLHSAKGKVVMGPDYPAVRAATPEIKYRMHWVVWVGLALIILIMLATFVNLMNRAPTT